MTYKPQPGTIPYRVINFLRLQPAGKEFTSAQLSEELDILGPTISSSLDYPRKMGLVQCHKGGNGLLYWSIGTGQAEPLPADYEPDLPLHELPPVRVRPSRAKAAVEAAPAAETHSDEKVAAASIGVKRARGTGINVEVIERLRSAALAHGEVADLLDVLADCFPAFAHGDSSFKGDDMDRTYLETVLIARQFAAFDRGEVAKGLVL